MFSELNREHNKQTKNDFGPYPTRMLQATLMTQKNNKQIVQEIDRYGKKQPKVKSVCSICVVGAFYSFHNFSWCGGNAVLISGSYDDCQQRMRYDSCQQRLRQRALKAPQFIPAAYLYQMCQLLKWKCPKITWLQNKKTTSRQLDQVFSGHYQCPFKLWKQIYQTLMTDLPHSLKITSMLMS